MTDVEKIRDLAKSYRDDAWTLKHWPTRIGYGYSNEDWFLIYRTVGNELDNAADLIELGDD